MTGCGGAPWSSRSSSRSDRRRSASARRPARRGRVDGRDPDDEARPHAALGRLQTTVPPCDWATERTIARPSPEPLAPSRPPRTKRSKTRSESSAGIPGPVSWTMRTASPSRAAVEASMRVPGGVWRTAFSSRLSTSRCSSSRTPSTIAGWASIDSPWRSAIGPSSAAASIRTSPRSVGRWGWTRRASARASSSRSPTSRRIRRVERSAASAVSACSPASSSVSRSRLASTLVRGVRSSCEASAMNSRCRSSIAWVSAREESRAPSIASSVRASSAISSLASGWGTCRLGSRVRSISRAASVSSRSAASRGWTRTGRPASPARFRRAPRGAGTPRPEPACGRGRTAARRTARSRCRPARH